MTLQTVLVLCLAALAAGFLLRRSFHGSRGCASGCGACASKTCALRKLEAELKATEKR